MIDFMPGKIETNIDFIAYSAARMEYNKRDISAESISGNMPLQMACQFYERLDFYRLAMQKDLSAVQSTSTG